MSQATSSTTLSAAAVCLGVATSVVISAADVALDITAEGLERRQFAQYWFIRTERSRFKAGSRRNRWHFLSVWSPRQTRHLYPRIVWMMHMIVTCMRTDDTGCHVQPVPAPIGAPSRTMGVNR